MNMRSSDSDHQNSCMAFHFATLFDSNYLSRGMALFESLVEHVSADFRLHVLALDGGVCRFFDKLNNDRIAVVHLEELETAYPELRTAKANRSVVEYYFTLSPYWPSFILSRFPKLERITTMDADLYFFSDPVAILERYADASVLITPHSFSAGLAYLEIFGKYNVSFQSFRNDAAAHRCLESWRVECLNWCYDYYDKEGDRFADQKYLDTWTRRFDGVKSIDVPGMGLAPWNIEKFSYQVAGKCISVNGQPLVYYHFHHLRLFAGNFAFNGLEIHKVNTSRKEVKLLYHRYLKELRAVSAANRTSEAGIMRINYFSNKAFFERFLSPGGYWFYTGRFITHINIRKKLSRLKQTVLRIIPRFRRRDLFVNADAKQGN